MMTGKNPPAGSATTGRPRVITLVHGTWARDAAWTKADSTLCRGLLRTVPPPTLRRFQWSGHNSHRARLRAARDLTGQLRETIAEFPDAEHHLIAHSHGGNVVLYALRDPVLSDRIASVVTLATPFIHARARPPEPAFLVLRWLICSLGLLPGTILGILAVLFAAAALQAPPDSPFAKFIHETGLPWPLILAALAVLSASVIWIGERMAGRATAWLIALLRPRVERYQQQLVNDYNHRANRALPVLNAQVERDEPARWLRLLQWISEPQADSRAVIALAGFFSLALGVSLVVDIFRDPTATESYFSMVFFAVFTVVSMLLVWTVMLVIGLLMSHMIFMLVPFITRGHGGGYGEWSLYANWLALIEARAEPAGGYRLENFRVTVRSKGLRHSQIYQDERVVARIDAWLSTDTEERMPSPARS